MTFNVTGGSGADTIKAHANGGTLIGGDGADTFTLGAGADIVDLTEDTPAVDTVKLAVNGAGITDTITGFTAGATTRIPTLVLMASFMVQEPRLAIPC